MIHLHYTQIVLPPPRAEARRAEHLAGRKLLCDVLGCAQEDIQVAPNGKPYLPCGPWFSVSHSNGLILLAVSEDGEVGCDVEWEGREIRNPETIRRKIALPGEDDEPLPRLWVRKEAVYKSGLGEGAKVYYPEMPEGYVAALCCLGENYADPIRH